MPRRRKDDEVVERLKTCWGLLFNALPLEKNVGRVLHAASNAE